MSAYGRVARSISLILAVVLLAGRFSLAESWLGLLAVFALAAFWFVGRRFNWPWLNSALLVGYVSATAGGIFLGISPHWMIAGSAFALAGWELSGMVSLQTNDSIHPWSDILQRNTLRLLVFSIGLGLMAAELLLSVRLAIPFGVILLAALLVFTSLFLFFRLNKPRPR